MLEDGSETCATNMVELLLHLARTAIVSQQQMQQVQTEAVCVCVCVCVCVRARALVTAGNFMSPGCFFAQGFLRVFGAMTELVLDAPYAYTTLNKLVERCVKTSIVTPQLAEQTPQR